MTDANDYERQFMEMLAQGAELAKNLIIDKMTLEVIDSVSGTVIEAVEQASAENEEVNARRTQIYKGIIAKLEEQVKKAEEIHIE